MPDGITGQFQLCPANARSDASSSQTLIIMYSLGAQIVGLKISTDSTPTAKQPGGTGAPIRVGVLNSLSGTLSISARPVIDATLLAIFTLGQAAYLGKKAAGDGSGSN